MAGEQLADRPWHQRRATLEHILTPGGRRVSLTETFDAEEAVHDQLVGLGFEGSVLKRRDGRYWPGQRSSLWRKVKTRSQCSSVLEVISPDPSGGVVERVGCRVADDPRGLTWAVVWNGSLRRQLTRELNDAIGRAAVVTYTHRTISGAKGGPAHRTALTMAWARVRSSVYLSGLLLPRMEAVAKSRSGERGPTPPNLRAEHPAEAHVALGQSCLTDDLELAPRKA